MQVLSDRPASAQATAGHPMSESVLTVSHSGRDGNIREESGDALAAQSSIFSLPVLKSEPVSTVTLLEDGGEKLSLSQVVINTPVHMKPLEDEPQDYCELSPMVIWHDFSVASLFCVQLSIMIGFNACFISLKEKQSLTLIRRYQIYSNRYWYRLQLVMSCLVYSGFSFRLIRLKSTHLLRISRSSLKAIK